MRRDWPLRERLRAVRILHTLEITNFMKLPVEHYLEAETHARNTLSDLIETLEAENIRLKAELKAERDLRAEIASDLREIEATFNKLIALK